LLIPLMMSEEKRRKRGREKEKRDSDKLNKNNESKMKSVRDENKLENKDFEILKIQILQQALPLWESLQKSLVNDPVENANVKREERREKRKNNVNKKNEIAKKRKGNRNEKC